MQNYKRNQCATFHIFLTCRLVTIVRKLIFCENISKVCRLAKKSLPNKSMYKNLTQEFSAIS